MTLATRASLFFLGSLVVTFVGFSASLYFLADNYLDRQLDERLEAALGNLTAAAEVSAEYVEWETEGRRLDLGSEGVRWVVRGPEGRIVDASSEPFPRDLLSVSEVQTGAASRLSRVMRNSKEPWRVFQTRLEPKQQKHNLQSASLGIQGTPNNNDRDNLFPSLAVTVALPVGPMEASLRHLLWTLTSVSLAIWTGAALIGHWLCRRTLAPVSRMANSARSIQASELGMRLQVDHTHDELDELGQAFNGLLDRLQEALERERRFSGEASHQLRTPLAIMLGQVEVALRRDRQPDEYRRVLEVVGEQAQRLHRIVEMLLFLARAEDEAPLPGLSSLCIHSWLEEHLKEWATHPRFADFCLLPPISHPLHVQAHPPLLGQVVDILLDNSCKFSKPGTPITLSVRSDGGQAILIVEDCGCGIAREELPMVFVPFFRSTRAQGATSGMGLGLAIARRAVNSMGGQIHVDSELGDGSRFTIRLARRFVQRIDIENAQKEFDYRRETYSPSL